MRTRPVTETLRVIGAATALLALTACAHGRVYVRVGPPPVRVEVIPHRPSADFVWIDGYWHWDVQAFTWMAGRWERIPRHGRIWIPGHWREHRRGWYWEPGRWR